MNISGISNSHRGFGVNSKKNTNIDSTAPSFEEQIAKQGDTGKVPTASTVADMPAVSAAMSGEEYLKLQQESAAANSPEAKSAAEHKALIETANQAPLEESTSGEKAAASKTSTVPPMPDFSGMSDSQKLSALRKLHEETDYSGMKPAERYKLIHDRIETAFPNAMALRSGLYGPRQVYNGSSIAQSKSLSSLLHDEIRHQQTEAGLSGISHSDLRREAYYSGMTDEEVVAAVNRRHDGGTIEDRAATMYELYNLGLDNGVGTEAIKAMRNSMLSQVRGEKVYGAINAMPRSSMEYSQLRSLAGSTRITWGEVGAMTLSTSYEYAVSSSNPSLALKEHEEFQEKWNELLELLMYAGG